MKMKQYHRYHIKFSGAWYNASCVFMGMSLFLMAIYYLGLTALADHGAAKSIFCLFLPLAATGGYIVLLRVLRWDAPGIYAMLGAFLCLLMIIGLFFTGNVIRILLGILWYAVCGFLLLAYAAGFLPEKLPVGVVFGIAIAVRVLFFSLGKLSLIGWIGEGATLFALAGLLCLPRLLVPVQGKQR